MLYLQTEGGTIEFRNPRLERLAGLTAADRKWMDDILYDVNESWDDADPKTSTLQCVLLPCISHKILRRVTQI
jgi:hypothetical protein